MIGIRVPPEVLTPIREEAERKGVKFSEVARAALAEFAAKLAAETADREAA
jgi:hypothetical protein